MNVFLSVIYPITTVSQPQQAFICLHSGILTVEYSAKYV